MIILLAIMERKAKSSFETGTGLPLKYAKDF